MLIVALCGFALAFVGSMPVWGPIGLLVFNRGIAGRYRAGLAVALGSALAEGTYAGTAALGADRISLTELSALRWVQLAGAVLLIGLGVHVSRTRRQTSDTARSQRRGGFLLGLTVSALNPALLLTWGTAITAVYASGWVTASPAHAVPYGIAVASGSTCWFMIWLSILNRHRERLPERWLVRLARAAGVFLILGGTVMGAHALWR